MTSHQEILSNLGVGESGQSILAATGNQFLYGLLYAVLGIAVIAAAYFLFRIASYNIRISVHEFSSSGKTVVRRRGKIYYSKLDKRVKKFKILGEKKYNTNYPGDQFFEYRASKMPWGLSFHKHINMARDEDGNLTPIRLLRRKDVVDWVGLTNPQMENYASIDREIEERFKPQDFWSKNGALILHGTIFVIFIIAMFILFDMMGDIGPAFSSAAGTCAETASVCAEAISTRQQIGG